MNLGYLQAQEKRSLGTFLWFSVHLAITSVNPSEIPTQPPWTLTHSLTLADPASGSPGPSSPLGDRLSLTVAFPWLLLISLGPCLSSSTSGLIGNLTHKLFVWVLRQNRWRNPLIATHPHPQKLMPPIVPQISHYRNGLVYCSESLHTTFPYHKYEEARVIIIISFEVLGLH